MRQNPGLLRHLLADEAEGLAVEFDLKIEKGWASVQAKGDDAEAFSNLLKKKYGERPVQASRVEKWDVLRGFVTVAGRVGYGVYVDVGISEPTSKDALYPLHRMRAQLSDGRQASAREILAENALLDSFPLRVIVTGFDGEKMDVELSDESQETLVSWRNHPWDRVIAVGLTHSQALRSLREMGAETDVVSVDSLSLFVQAFVLKVGTEAPGIISRMGRRLRGVSLAAYTKHRMME